MWWYIRNKGVTNPYPLWLIILTLSSLSGIFSFWDFHPPSHCYPVKEQCRTREQPLEGRAQMQLMRVASIRLAALIFII